MYYLNSRYYNPEWGRFINADGLAGKTGELLSHNMFAYCRNNPVNRFDENGYRDEELLAFALADGPEPGPADVIAVAAYAVDNLVPIIEEEGEVIYGDLEYAAEYGIKEYTSLVENLKDTGLRAHHIVEKRFAVALNNIEKDFMDSVAVTKDEHQAFTNAWRAIFPYGKTDYVSLSKEKVWDAAQLIYKDYSGLLNSAKETIWGK